jgi:hypothetical protein
MLKLLDVVAVLEDVPEEKLERGDVGTVVEIFPSNETRDTGLMIEFSVENGAAYAIPVLQEKQIMRLRYKIAA